MSDTPRVAPPGPEVKGPWSVAAVLGAIGGLCARRRYAVIALWLVLAAGTGAAGVFHGGMFLRDASFPGMPSQQAIDLAHRDFPQYTGPTATLVFHPRQGRSLDDWRVELNVGRSLDAMRRLPRVAYVDNPYAPGPARPHSGRASLAVVHFKGTLRDLTIADLDALKAAAEPAAKSGVEMEVGGPIAIVAAQPESSWQEAAGIVLALLVLLLVFRSMLAAALPVMLALSALAVAYSLIELGAAVFAVHPLAPIVAAMLGLGAGIDYALLVVTRHREFLAAGVDVADSVRHAMATAGHAVLFAGGTVVVAICGLWASGVAFVGRIGLASAVSVLVTVLAAVTLLPAALGALGTRLVPSRQAAPRGGPGAAQGGRSERWGRHVTRHPWPYALGAAALLLFLALPALHLQFGVASDATLPHGNTARQAYDVTAREFGRGQYSPLLVVVRVPPAGEARTRAAGTVRLPAGVPRTQANLQQAERLREFERLKVRQDRTTGYAARLKKRIEAVDGVASVREPIVSKDTALLKVVPRSAPHDQATADLARTLRTSVLPAFDRAEPGALARLGGETPVLLDMADLVRERLPRVVAVVVGISVILLVIAFRSIVVPLKAALMNLLSIGASYGVLVAVFQWGWGVRLVGLDEPVPIVSFVPLFMFALIFGLSMDYEVFLLARIREEYARTGDPNGGVVTGLAATARLIGSAALIMICVFLSFLGQPDAMVKMAALGLAVAVAVDATVVRLVLVPAFMALLGHANWWFPGRRRPGGAGGHGEGRAVPRPEATEPPALPEVRR